MQQKACIFNIQKFSIHDGPGIRTVVFFKGCPLNCYWCSNPESKSGLPEQMWDQQKKAYTTVGEYKSVDDIVTEVMKDAPFYEESDGGVTLSGGEVLYQAEFAINLLTELKKRGIHTACETTGYANRETFDRFMNDVDLVYFDVKHYASDSHRHGTGVRNDLIIDNLKAAVASHKNLIVRIPVIPFYNDSIDDARAFARLFNELSIKNVELLPFHQFGEKKYDYLNRGYSMHHIHQLHTEDLADFKKVMTDSHIQCFVH